MTTESSTPDDATGDGTEDATGGEVPNTETGAGLGAGEPTTFEPEEDPEAVPDPE